MRRLLLIVLLSLVMLISVLLIIENSLTDKSIIKERIEFNLDQILKKQKSDLDDFGNQFGIYSNPFDISSNLTFNKRVFVNKELAYWSDNKLIGEYGEFNNPKSQYLLQLNKNIYAVRKLTISSSKPLIEVFSFIPLYTNPSIKNIYLKEEFNQDVFEEYEIRLNKGTESIEVQDLLIAVSINDQPSYRFDNLILFFIILAIMVFLSLVIISNKSESYKWGNVLIGIIIIRGFLWVFTNYLVKNPLFDPIYYTSKYGSSLTDLFLNVIVLYVIIQAFFSYLKQNPIRVNNWIALICSIVLLHISAFMLFKLSWNIQNNSLISLDIAEFIVFDKYRILAYSILVILGSLFYQLFRISKSIVTSLDFNWIIVIGLYLIVSMIFIFLSGTISFIYFFLLSITFIIIYFSKIDFDSSNLDYRSFIYGSLLIGYIAASLTISVLQHHAKDELVSKKRFANRLLIKNDFLGEYYLDKKVREISKDPYIRSRLSNPLLPNDNIEERIKSQYLSSYFDKYEIELSLFDAKGNSYENNEFSYDALIELYHVNDFTTDYNNIYFVRDVEGNLQDRYFCFIPIHSFDQNVGFVVLTLTLKKYIPKSVFPQLMVESRYYFGDENRFDYAFYKEGKLLYKRGRLEFLNSLDYPTLNKPKLFEQGVEIGGNHFYALKTNDETTIVIASPSYRFNNLISNFSFFYLLLLFSFALVLTLRRILDKEIVFNLSSKIQLYLGLSLIIPMLIVSIALLNTLNQSYKEEIDKSFSKKAYNISSKLISACENYIRNDINKDDLNAIVSEIASLIQSDINLYSAEGELIVSSEREIFKNGLLSSYIDPLAYNAIKYGNTESKVYNQSIGELDFRVSYLSLRSHIDGHLIGILSLPYFNSKNHLKRQQVEVFNNLISIFTIIFIISIILGNLAIEKLLKPIRIIAERLKTTDLKEVNKEIEYTSADEVGVLIKEYNLMIAKLEESKIALAESQKESAWKEIARQVAHEIKNPLTPMRLKIQQMMREKDSDAKEYTSLNSLIGQIDRLSSIADSFSAFAKMPAPKNERFNINELISSVADVHSREGVPVKTQLSNEPIFVNTDPKIFSGILNNIILNAQQSVVDKAPKVSITIEHKPKKVVLQIHDNGEGIEEENKEKIFTPYFSTKATGSGIGLAVAKKGIENAGGNIWFESKVGEGTTFFISLPVVS